MQREPTAGSEEGYLSPRRRLRSRRWLPDVLGVLWVTAAGLAVLAPALVHGVSLGPFDLLSQHGLSKQPGVVVHNSAALDQIDTVIPWSTLAWTQVHQGHLPLWNAYSGLGMPLAFNWQAAPFGLPALVGYLVPVRMAYTVGVLVTVTIAGTGAYVLGRVIRLGVLASALVGTTYALSGPLLTQLGYPLASVMCWAGWLFAAAILIVRGRSRARCIALFAVILALAIYAGHPESAVMLIIALVLFLVVLLALRAPWLGGSGAIVRPVIDLAVAMVTGAALAAPIALPSLQLTSGSIRSTASGLQSLPLHTALYLVFRGFDGLPLAGSQAFGTRTGSNIPVSLSFFYNETSAYIGVIAIVLCAMAVALRRRRPEVLPFAVVAIVMAGLVFLPGVKSVWNSLPVLEKVNWLRALTPMALAVAVLAGVGLDTLVRSYAKRPVRHWTGAGFVVAGLVLLGLWVAGRGHLPPAQASIRARSFIWPATETAVGLAVVGALTVLQLDKLRYRLASSNARHRRPAPSGRLSLGAGTFAGLSFLACTTAFLLAAGTPFWSSSAEFFAPTPAVRALQQSVGSATVGFGADTCLSGNLGVLPDANVAYGVHELSVYDPIVPRAYYQSWKAITGKEGGLPSLNLFCPPVATADLARRYGVAFVLEPRGARGPAGAIFDRKVGDEDLYRIPGASAATLTPIAVSGSLPPTDAMGVPVEVTYPDAATWKLTTSSATPQALRLRLTDVPGWHATVDGQPLPLEQFAGAMLQARIPAGQHVVQLHYWPRAFTIGIVIAACALVGLAVPLVLGIRALLTSRRES